MTALLDLPGVRERVHLMSVDEYHRAGESGLLSDDIELLRGILITKIPKTPLDEFVIGKLIQMLRALLSSEFTIREDSPLTLRESEPEPDISVVKGKWEDWLQAHPSTASLVIEVAVTSRVIDESKAEIYAEAGIPEYWLVRPEKREVDIFLEPAGDRYQTKHTLRERDVLKSEVFPHVAFKVSDILPPKV
jgi:Uma2 family endonuclease